MWGGRKARARRSSLHIEGTAAQTFLSCSCSFFRYASHNRLPLSFLFSPPSLSPIETGSSANEADYKEAVYEAYGYGGAGIIINCLTDNTNRAKTEINNVIKKSSVKLGTVGSVSYNFERKGRLDLAGVMDEDSVLEAALEADVEEVDTKTNEEENTTSVWVDTASVSGLREVLLEKGVEIKASTLVNVPKALVDCSDEDFEGNMSVIEALEELDDVDSVEHNVAMEDEEEGE